MDPLGPTLRRTRRRERPAWRALLAVGLSLLVNLLVVTQLDASWLGVHQGGPRRDVAIAPLTARDWEANRQVRPVLPGQAPAQAQLPPPPAAAPRPKETPAPPGQLVQVDESAAKVKEVAPKETRFVSDRDRTVEKESKARLVPDADGLERPKPTPPPAVAAGAGGREKAAVPGEEGAKGPKGPAAAKEERVARAPTAAEAAAKAPQGRGERAPAPAGPAPTEAGGGGAGGAPAAGEPDRRLALDASTMAKVLGRPVGQGIDDVEEGEGTFLSTRSWKYATYFNRIRESVGNAWRPNKEISRRDPDGSLYFFKDRLTVLSVTLDERGGLKDVQVVRSSSVDFLDRIAVEAFQKAQPFTNPPAGLVNAQGEIRYVLGFEVYGARPGLHMFKGPAPF
jgi:TonB family protein